MFNVNLSTVVALLTVAYVAAFTALVHQSSTMLLNATHIGPAHVAVASGAIVPLVLVWVIVDQRAYERRTH